MRQRALTVVYPIDEQPPGTLDALLELLGRIQVEIRAGVTHRSQQAILAFGDLETVHFARFVILRPPEEEDRPGLPANRFPVPAKLVFATTYDGSRERHLKELVEVAGPGLELIFSHCRHFKELPTTGRERLLQILGGDVDNECFYEGHRGRSVAQIRNEALLRSEIETVLSENSGRLARDAHAEAVDACERRDDLRWALSPPDPTRLSFWSKAKLASEMVLFALLLPLVLLPLALALFALELRDDWQQRRRELTLDEDVIRRLHEHKRLLVDAEDLGVQNQLTVVSPVKPGWIRLLTLRAVLWFVHRLARVRFDRGTLAGIPSIHFARWFLVDDGGGQRRLVFFSDYDGSWENYLGQFVDQASIGITPIWSNCTGFPPTRLLVARGSRDEQRFKAYVRLNQIMIPVWYSAYPDLTVANINNNSEIRRSLVEPSGRAKDPRWLRRF